MNGYPFGQQFILDTCTVDGEKIKFFVRPVENEKPNKKQKGRSLRLLTAPGDSGRLPNEIVLFEPIKLKKLLLNVDNAPFHQLFDPKPDYNVPKDVIIHLYINREDAGVTYCICLSNIIVRIQAKAD